MNEQGPTDEEKMDEMPEIETPYYPPEEWGSLDEYWFNKLEATGSFEDVFDKESGEQKQQYDLFMSGQIENPNFSYPNINAEEISKVEKKVIALKEELLLKEDRLAIRECYRWRLNERIAYLRMLKSIASGDMHRFKRYSWFLYGRPQPEIFNANLYLLHKQLDLDMQSQNADLQQAALNLNNLLPQTNQSAPTPNLPDEQSIASARENTQQLAQNLMPSLEPNKTYGAEEIQSAFVQALQNLRAPGWQVIIGPETRKVLGVRGASKKVLIGPKQEFSAQRLTELIAHEIGTHVARRQNGERSHLKLLSSGLDRYLPGEEGIATMREQALANKVEEFARLDRHLAIGLVWGIDGIQRNFRQTFEIMETFYYWQSLKSQTETTIAKNKAKEKAWDLCVRIFKGADCTTPGVCYSKDIVYHEGNINIWDVIRDDPKEMIRFNIGKYNPHNPRHLWILSTLGISDEDLENLN